MILHRIIIVLHRFLLCENIQVKIQVKIQVTQPVTPLCMWYQRNVITKFRGKYSWKVIKKHRKQLISRPH